MTRFQFLVFLTQALASSRVIWSTVRHTLRCGLKLRKPFRLIAYPEFHREFCMTSEYDPRVFFAAERTLLAWLRTGIASIGLGFLVARFGYFLMMINGRVSSTHYASSVIGIALVLLGTLMIGLSSWQHGRFITTLRSEHLPQRYSARLSVMISTFMVVAGIALAIYLAMAIGKKESNGEHGTSIQRKFEG